MPDPVFILSTGRTGTQFFEKYLTETGESVLCLHEPSPSRRFKFLSNMFLNGRVTADHVCRVYEKSRKEIFSQSDAAIYVESSNFIFGCMQALRVKYPGLKVVHIIREPRSYVISHLAKGFWRGRKRLFARHVPYWLEKLDTPSRKDPIELLAARWTYVNRQIASYGDDIPYLFLRFEDLFSQDEALGSEHLNRIREFIGLEALSQEENALWLSRPANASQRKYELKAEQLRTISKHTASELKAFGYENPGS